MLWFQGGNNTVSLSTTSLLVSIPCRGMCFLNCLALLRRVLEPFSWCDLLRCS
uniref:Uncharacterized protein n=1 Tax=Arundo donax TaxID=35708 RepID=A0A0A9R4E4_ARUDO